jgi:hypothetical protein
MFKDGDVVRVLRKEGIHGGEIPVGAIGWVKYCPRFNIASESACSHVIFLQGWNNGQDEGWWILNHHLEKVEAELINPVNGDEDV